MKASIILVAGARPNFMKIAPVLRALHTGQHYDAALSQVFFDELGIPAPDVHLDVGSGTHGAQTALLRGAASPTCSLRRGRDGCSPWTPTSR
jgi:UDP-N-acetylglucosamine 2-epimerase (non-hydrolysing)